MRAWVEHWLEQLRLGTASSARARQAITAKVARDLIRATARKLRKRADALKETSDADAFHEVRIRAKRLRYALDAFGSLYGEAAQEYLDALARLQHVLGEFHDSAVRTEMFAQIVTHGRRVPAATSFLVGRLVERDQRKFEKCRRRFAKAYRRIRRGRWRALSEAMREMESSISPAPVRESS
jgi:CHAD domain-containing protein